MNDLDILDRLGPRPTPLSEATLAAARDRLNAAMASTAAPTSRSSARRSRRLPLLITAAAAAVGIAVVPTLFGSQGSIALAAVDPLSFPVTATWLPDGAGSPVFSGEPGFQLARYGAGDDRISIFVSGDLSRLDVPDSSTALDVAGVRGHGYDSRGDDGNEASYTIEWKEGSDFVEVTGKGRFADPALVESVADSVDDRPQRVDLFLTIAPQGWQVFGYQSDHHVTYVDSGSSEHGDGTDLTVGIIERVSADLAGYGARDVRDVSIDGREGVIGRQVNTHGDTVAWVLQTAAPDGQAFALNAPGALTADQVIKIAAGVGHHD